MKYVKSDGTSEEIPQKQGKASTNPDGSTTFTMDGTLEYTEIAPGIIVKAADLIREPAAFRKYYTGKAAEWERWLWSVGNAFYNGLPEDLQAKIDKQEKQLFKGEKATHKKARLLTNQQTRSHSTQMDIFNSLGDDIKSEIETDTKKKPPKIYGPALTTREHLLIDAIQKLLHQKSEIYDTTSEKYYAGNYEPKDGSKVMKFDVPTKSSYTEERTSPAIKFTRNELAKEFTGGRTPSGKDQAEAMEILRKIAGRKYLFVYEEKLPDSKDGNPRRREIEHYTQLFELLIDRDLEGDKKTKTEKIIREEIAIRLHPIFRTNIDTKFITAPDDIIRRTRAASGGREIDHATLQLRDYLLQEHSQKRYNVKISVSKLYSIIAEKYRLRKDYPTCRKKMMQGIEICKNLGILEGWKEEPGAGGEPMIIFALCREWI